MTKQISCLLLYPESRRYRAVCVIALAMLLVCCAPAMDAGTGKDRNDRTVKLYGRIDVLTYLCSTAGIQLNARKLPSKVSGIALGSAAAYSGLRAGDMVTDIVTDPNKLIVSIDRDGKKYRATIAMNVAGLKAQFEERKIPFSVGDSPFDNEMKELAKYEVVILLDRSKSMDEKNAGVPGDISKWSWCRQQIDNVYLATARVLDGGFKLVLFDRGYQIRQGVTLWDLKQVFDRLKPEVDDKNISQPLEMVLNRYLKDKTPKSKPLLVIVLSDGKRNSGTPLQTVLINVSKRSNPGEIVVTFMQVGNSITGEELFDDLSHNLVAKGARYRMVYYKPFSDLRNRGLLQEILATVRQVRQGT